MKAILRRWLLALIGSDIDAAVDRAVDVFLQERCVLGADAWLKSSELYRAYRLFCSENRLLGVGRVLFVKLMEARCYERSRSRRTIAGVQMRTYEGICLKAGGGEAQFTGCDSVKRTALP